MGQILPAFSLPRYSVGKELLASAEDKQIGSILSQKDP